MDPFLRCTDYLGREVRLDPEQWYGHIVSQRPLFIGLLDEVRAVVESPDRVQLDADNDQRECFYRQGPVAAYPRLYLKVIIDYGPRREIAQQGVIVTAFLTSRYRPKEALLWKI